MTYCPECGEENDPKARFCAKCGSSLLAISRPTPREEKYEKHEKEEKYEKHEKEEKYEKHEGAAISQLIGGLILVLFGVAFYLSVNDIISIEVTWPYFIIGVGLVIIVLALFGGRMASQRHPKP